MFIIYTWEKPTTDLLVLIILFKVVDTYTINVLYLAGTKFGENKFLNKLAWILISVFLNVTFLIHICMPFSDVLDFAEAAFCQKS